MPRVAAYARDVAPASGTHDRGLVAVAGMHRGGTSTLARAINLLGIAAGDPDRLMAATDDNPGGYWENLRVAQLHDELLSHLGGWWNAPPVLEPGWERDPALSPFWTWGAQLVQDHYEPYGRCFVKDPRLCFLLPFWNVLTPVEPVVFGVRHPAAVAGSLARRDGFAPDLAAWLWLRHLDGMEAVAPEALVVDYDDWFVDADAVVGRLVEHLGVPAPDGPTSQAVTEWIRPELRRSGARVDVGEGAGLLRLATDAFHEVRARGLGGERSWAGRLPADWRERPPG